MLNAPDPVDGAAADATAPALRTWCYVQPPAAYGVASCGCGNTQTQWSEFQGLLWCAKCEKDFKPVHGGIFDGPVPVGMAQVMGISFDRIILATKEVQRFDAESAQYVSSTGVAVSLADIVESNPPTADGTLQPQGDRAIRRRP